MTIMQHLERAFGTSGSTIVDTREVRVLLWPDPKCDELGLACTVGMSNRTQTVPKGESCPSRKPRTELMSYCHMDDANVWANLLVDLSTYPFREGGFVFWWHTLRIGRPLVRRSSLDSILFSFPPLADDQVTFLVDRKRVDLVWAIPITASEHEFCETHGIEAFEEQLEKTNVDIADLFRKPICG